jgi:Rad52/22 family double-strand break repair protein
MNAQPITNAAALAAVPQQQTQQAPSGPGEWTIAQITAALSRPLPKQLTETRKQGGKSLTFIPWHQVNRVLDKYAIGWSWTITSIITTDDRIFLTGRLTIPTCDGDISREATGTEELKEIKTDIKTGEVTIKERAYGDPSSNAESMAFRRAAARFGLGLYLYDK